jgi:phage regulator Rha-like protein
MKQKQTDDGIVPEPLLNEDGIVALFDSEKVAEMFCKRHSIIHYETYTWAYYD